MSDKDQIIDTFTELAPRYEQVVDSELQTFWGWSYADFVKRIIDLTPVDSGEIVLDIATGTAVIPRKLIDRDGDNKQIYGLDLTFAMLQGSKAKIQEKTEYAEIKLVCASAMEVPFKQNVFDVIFCCLATHHMDVLSLLANIHRIMKPGGTLTIADVSAAPLWRTPGVKMLLKAFAFIYFMFKEGLNRAYAEASAVSNIRTSHEWQRSLEETGFSNIHITSLPSNRSWIPAPLFMQAWK